MHPTEPRSPAAPPLTRFLRLPEVMRLTGLGQDSIYRLGREGSFPKPRKISERATGWREDEIRTWIDSRPELDPQAPLTAPAIEASRIARAGKRRRRVA